MAHPSGRRYLALDMNAPTWVNRRLGPRGRWRRRWLGELGLVLVAIALIELLAAWLFHADFFANSYPHGRRLVQLYRDGQVDDAPPVQAHPYRLYTRTPGYAGQFNSLGYRNAEFDIAKPVGTLRIVCLGGSTTDMHPYQPVRDSTWPARLERRLLLALGRPVQVINAGLPGATSAELLSAYVHQHRLLRADWVIWHEGGNDVIPALYPGYRADYTHYRAPGVGPRPRPFERSLLASQLFKVVYAIWLNSTPVAVAQQPAALAAISADSALARVRRVPPAGLGRNLDAFLRYTRADSARVLVVPFIQASAGRIDRTPGFEGKGQALTEGLALNRGLMQRIAQQHGAAWADLPPDLIPDSSYMDNCHPTARGEALKAEAIATALLAQLQPLPPRRGRR